MPRPDNSVDFPIALAGFGGYDFRPLFDGNSIANRSVAMIGSSALRKDIVLSLSDSEQIFKELSAVEAIPLNESVNALKRHSQAVSFSKRPSDLLWTKLQDQIDQH